ncbi:MAG TPA: NTP transferase domain-containing protein [Candidatus Limnocylindria bacterium]|nr:NTP transferase domain-containing protein [Candidatus Limnocylindria bacterium]
MTHRSATTAIVLAGGRSSRFGGPKLAADLDGATVLEHATRAVEAVAGEIVVAVDPSNLPESIAARPIRVVVDEAPFAGPLAALAGALQGVTTKLAIVVGGDMPRLVPAVLEAMVDRLTSADVDAVVLEDATHRQVLPFAIRVGPARVAATDALAAGDRSLVRFVDRLRSTELAADVWRALDPDGRTLDDVDEPGDLDRLRAPQMR